MFTNSSKYLDICRDPELLLKLWARISPEPNSGCWIWTGGDSGGDPHKNYGRFRYKGITYAVHRLLYAATHGVLPDELVLDHTCRVTLCCNPAHVEPVTDQVNTLRGNTRAANQLAQTHCVNGHALSGENLRMAGRKRVCRTCNIVNSREWRNRRVRVAA